MILRISIALLAVAPAVPSSAEELNILFLGNSFTARHDIAGLVEQILEEGDPTADVQVQRVIYGGQNMFKHSTYYFSQSFIEQSTLTEETITQRIAANLMRRKELAVAIGDISTDNLAAVMVTAERSVSPASSVTVTSKVCVSGP